MNVRQTTLALLAATLACLPVSPVAASTRDDATPRDTVVVLHGLGRSPSSVWLLAERIEAAGFRVERVGYRSLRDDPRGVLANVRSQIDRCCAQRDGQVHFVGHSLGGLLARAYLADRPLKNLGRVVLIGSPSQGTPVVDDYRDSWWMKLAGPTAAALGTGTNSFPKSLPRPDYPLGVIAGRSTRLVEYPAIAGEDDGLVPVDATRVEGMQDFVVVDAGHAMLRYKEQAAEQAITFLRFGHFQHPATPE